jgi:hypothetical protein
MTFLQPFMTSIVTGLFVFAGLILAVLLYRTFNRRMSSAKGARLGVSETFDVDTDRRLILVRRDDVEHLVMIGGEHDLVIEQNIETGLMTAQPSLPISHHNVQQLPVRPAPRAPAFGGKRPSLRPVEPVVRQAEPEVEPLFPPRDPN